LAKPVPPPLSKEKHPLDTDEPFVISDDQRQAMLKAKSDYEELSRNAKPNIKAVDHQIDVSPIYD
jgi:hypothetical protein